MEEVVGYRAVLNCTGEAKVGYSAIDFFDVDAVDPALRRDLQYDQGDSVFHPFGRPSQDDIAWVLGLDVGGDPYFVKLLAQLGLPQQKSQWRSNVVKFADWCF